MHDTARPIARNTPQRVAAAMGLRRVEGVRVVVGDGPVVAEVTGVAHRYPRTFRISLAAAARLAEVGVPVRIDRRGELTYDGALRP